MSHTNETLHYHLPKYVGTDIINPMTDFNDANDVIDEALYDANQTAANAVEIAQGASGEVVSYDARITEAETLANTAITKADNTMDMIADEFDPLKEGGYQIGDSVIYNQKLFTFINPHTGAWDAGDVKQGTITEAVEDTISEGEEAIRQEVQDALAEIAGQTEKVTATQKMIAPPFDPNKQGGYVASEVVTYADKLYQFDSDHVGAWTGLDVHQTDMIAMQDETVNGIMGKIENKVMLSEEQFYQNTANTTMAAKIKDCIDHVIALFNNKPANAVDIIVDGIDFAGRSFVCEWSMYDAVVNSKRLYTPFVAMDLSSGLVVFQSIVYMNNAVYYHNFDMWSSSTQQVATQSRIDDAGAQTSSDVVNIAYHYLYKVE